MRGARHPRCLRPGDPGPLRDADGFDDLANEPRDGFGPRDAEGAASVTRMEPRVSTNDGHAAEQERVAAEQGRLAVERDNALALANALQNLRLFRYTRAPRAVYGFLLRFVRRRRV